MPKAVLVMALMLAATPAVAQTVTKAQIRAQDAAATERDLKDQLWSMFVPRSERGNATWKPQRVLETIVRTTTPYPVSGGLCRRDTITMRFVPEPWMDRMTANAETPVRAYGLDVTHGYQLADPAVRVGPSSDWDTARGWPVCAAKAGEAFAAADSDRTALLGLRALRLGLAAVAEGKLSPICKSRYAPGVTCENVYGRAIAGRPLSVEECDRMIRDSVGGTCFAAQYPHGMLVIRTAGYGGAVESVELLDVFVIDDSGLQTD